MDIPTLMLLGLAVKKIQTQLGSKTCMTLKKGTSQVLKQASVCLTWVVKNLTPIGDPVLQINLKAATSTVTSIIHLIMRTNFTLHKGIYSVLALIS